MKLRKVKHLREQNNKILKELREEIFTLKAEVKNLTDILIESNIIEDIDMSGVRYRKENISSGWFDYTTNVPYIVNKAKVKQ